MGARFTQLLQHLGFTVRSDSPLTDGDQPAAPHAQLRIEPGSTLDAIAALNPSSAVTYADAVACEIKEAIATCTIGDLETTTAQALEQIHSLKNAIAATGSPELLKACEQLRLDACHSAQRAALAQRFRAVASSATLLVRNYRRTHARDDLESPS